LGRNIPRDLTSPDWKNLLYSWSCEWRGVTLSQRREWEGKGHKLQGPGGGQRKCFVGEGGRLQTTQGSWAGIGARKKIKKSPGRISERYSGGQKHPYSPQERMGRRFHKQKGQRGKEQPQQRPTVSGQIGWVKRNEGEEREGKGASKWRSFAPPNRGKAKVCLTIGEPPLANGKRGTGNNERSLLSGREGRAT